MSVQLGLALVRVWWDGHYQTHWMREVERWPGCIVVTGWHGMHIIRFEDVLDAGWL